MKLIGTTGLLFAVGVSLVLCSCISVKFTRVNSWSESDIQDKSGILTIPQDTGLSFEYSNENLPVAGVLSTDGYSKDIVILFDTGSRGDKLLPFTDVQDTDTKFITQDVLGPILRGGDTFFFIKHVPLLLRIHLCSRIHRCTDEHC